MGRASVPAGQWAARDGRPTVKGTLNTYLYQGSEATRLVFLCYQAFFSLISQRARMVNIRMPTVITREAPQALACQSG